MQPKSRAIESLIAEFTAILLNELPITLDGLVFMGFSLKLIHDLDTYTTHSTAEMLYNMEAVEYYFCIRECNSLGDCFSLSLEIRKRSCLANL